MDHFGNLRDVYLEQLQDLHSVESQILEALPKVAKAAHNEKLDKALRHHRDVTQKQRERLEKILKEMGEKPGKEHCHGMEGILKEGDEVVKTSGKSAAKDAALIAAAQRVEHYEIAAYGTAVAMAKELGYGDAADLLEASLDEEKDADVELSKLATGGILRSGINEMAETR